MIDLTAKEREILNDLQGAVARCMRSKPTLRVLSSLQSKGLIEFDPFSGTAKPTEVGLKVM